MVRSRDFRRRGPALAAALIAAVIAATLLQFSSDVAPADRRQLLLSEMSQYAEPKSVVLRGGGGSSPRYVITEDEVTFRLEVEVPGVQPEGMKTDLEDNGRVLHVVGTRRSTAASSFHPQEHNAIDERFNLGWDLDTSKIAAHMSYGVLVVTMPKKQGLSQANQDVPILQGDASELMAPTLLNVGGQEDAQEETRTLTDAQDNGDVIAVDAEAQGERIYDERVEALGTDAAQDDAQVKALGTGAAQDGVQPEALALDSVQDDLQVEALVEGTARDDPQGEALTVVDAQHDSKIDITAADADPNIISESVPLTEDAGVDVGALTEHILSTTFAHALGRTAEPYANEVPIFWSVGGSHGHGPVGRIPDKIARCFPNVVQAGCSNGHGEVDRPSPDKLTIVQKKVQAGDEDGVSVDGLMCVNVDLFSAGGVLRADLHPAIIGLFSPPSSWDENLPPPMAMIHGTILPAQNRISLYHGKYKKELGNISLLEFVNSESIVANNYIVRILSGQWEEGSPVTEVHLQVAKNIISRKVQLWPMRFEDDMITHLAGRYGWQDGAMDFQKGDPEGPTLGMDCVVPPPETDTTEGEVSLVDRKLPAKREQNAAQLEANRIIKEKNELDEQLFHYVMAMY